MSSTKRIYTISIHMEFRVLLFWAFAASTSFSRTSIWKAIRHAQYIYRSDSSTKLAVELLRNCSKWEKEVSPRISSVFHNPIVQSIRGGNLADTDTIRSTDCRLSTSSREARRQGNKTGEILDREGHIDLISFFAHIQQLQSSFRTALALEQEGPSNNRSRNLPATRSNPESARRISASMAAGVHSGSKDRTNQRHKRCQYAGPNGACSGVARYGDRREVSPRLCCAHRNASHVDLRNRRCSAPEGCERLASFGSPGRGGALFCAAHKRVADVNVRRRLCLHRNCTRLATYATAVAGGCVADRCAAHALAGHRSVRSNACRQPGCGKEASYGPPRPAEGRNGREVAWEGRMYCAAHRREGQVPGSGDGGDGGDGGEAWSQAVAAAVEGNRAVCDCRRRS
jgi:hypothetical protein